MDFWPSALGFFLGLAANKVSEHWARIQAYRRAKKLAGEWIAYNYDEGNPRKIEEKPMPGAGLTVISFKPWWWPHSHVLDVSAEDLDSGDVRLHHGWIAIDPERPQLATRTIFYDECDEIAEQRLVISDDGNTLFVFDKSAGGGYRRKHALRRHQAGSGILAPMGDESSCSVTEEEKGILSDRRRYASFGFALSCLWLIAIAILLWLNAVSVVHISDPVLIASIAAIPALFCGCLFPVSQRTCAIIALSLCLF